MTEVNIKQTTCSLSKNWKNQSNVAPIKYITIPRTVLVAATLSVKISALLWKELQLPNVKEKFWIDSSVFLGYIWNGFRKFRLIVANKLEVIRDHTNIHQWHYIDTKDNLADYSSRGANEEYDKAVEYCFWGPPFLRKPETKWNIQDNKGRIVQDDPETKKCLQINRIEIGKVILEALEGRKSSWYKMKRVAAMVLR